SSGREKDGGRFYLPPPPPRAWPVVGPRSLCGGWDGVGAAPAPSCAAPAPSYDAPAPSCAVLAPSCAMFAPSYAPLTPSCAVFAHLCAAVVKLCRLSARLTSFLTLSLGMDLGSLDRWPTCLATRAIPRRGGDKIRSGSMADSWIPEDDGTLDT